MNKDRLERFGKALAIESQKYRAKRIAVNVRVNGLAFTVEVLGGFVLAFLSLLRPHAILYIGAGIWYGSLIPSCYLINSVDTKIMIMEHGWMKTLRNLYKKRTPKGKPTSAIRRKSNSNGDEPPIAWPTTDSQKMKKTRALENADGNTKNLPPKPKALANKEFNETKTRISRGVILHDLKDVGIF